MTPVRAAAVAAGGLLTAAALRKRGLFGVASAAVGSQLLYGGVTGKSPLRRVLHLDRQPSGASAVVAHGQGSKVEASLIIDRPRQELFAFWRNFENLPQFMDYLDSVEVLNRERSRWTLQLPIAPLVWEAEIYQEQPGDLLSWRSTPDAPITHAGTVRFDDATGGRGTKVSLVINYSPPLGKLGAAAAHLLPQDPRRQAVDALRKLKQLMETGEIATSRIRRDAMANHLTAAGASTGRSS
jgi:uncharacterized membrane protein